MIEQYPIKSRVVCYFSYHSGMARIRVSDSLKNLHESEVFGEDLPDVLDELRLQWPGLVVTLLDYRPHLPIEAEFNYKIQRKLKWD